MSPPSPLSVLSNALKIADKVTVSMKAVGNKIPVNSQGWEDARVLTERQVLMVVAYKGQRLMFGPDGDQRRCQCPMVVPRQRRGTTQPRR
jgi:hypothetical protein